MVIKLYVSGISGNKEVKKKQQRVQMILDSKQIVYETIDITEPGREKEKEFMQQNGKVRENLGKYPLPPQIFNDEDFCGDYEDFDMANEVDELEKFLHIECSKIVDNETKNNEDSRNFDEENIACKSSTNNVYNFYDYHTYKVKWDSVNGLQEQIIDSTTGENDQAQEVKESEVNGVVEDITTSKEIDSDPKTTEDKLKEEKEEKNLESDNLSENGNKYVKGENEESLEGANKGENEQSEKEEKNTEDIEEENCLKTTNEGENEENIKNTEASQKELENQESEKEEQNAESTEEQNNREEEVEEEKIEEGINESMKSESKVEDDNENDKENDKEELNSDESEKSEE